MSEPTPRSSRLATRALALRNAARHLIVRYLPSESQHVFALTVLVGLVCGLVAVGFHLSIRAVEHLLIERAMSAPGWSWMLWGSLSPALGGLVAGLVLAYLVPGARGSGIPQVKQAYALAGGRVPLRDTVGKFALGALQIGSGGSLGREGPTVQICAGVASFLARATWLPHKAMRRLTPVGVAAGIAAAFNAPIAAVTFTIEEIVGDLDQTVLGGVVVAAALAAVIERSVLGTHPVIEVAQPYGLDHASSLPLYALLGVAAALLSVVFTDGLLELRARFRRSRVPLWLQPALGGLGCGVIAVAVMRLGHSDGIAGGGYATLGAALDGKLAVHVLAMLCIAKLFATVSSYGSGGAGGIFAPTLFMGAMLGGVMGYLDVTALHHPGHEVGAFALVGMGAVFAGVVRAPITSVLIIFEMTGGYGLVLPLMIANMSSFAIARHMRPIGVYDALLRQDGVTLPHGAPDPMHEVKVRLLVELTEPVAADAPLSTVMQRLLASRGGALACGPDELGGWGLCLLDHARELWNERDLDRVVVAADLARRLPSVGVDSDLIHALRLMDEQTVDALPVVDPQTRRAIGVVTRAEIGRFLFHQYSRRQKITSRSGLSALSDDAAPVSSSTTARVP